MVKYGPAGGRGDPVRKTETQATTLMAHRSFLNRGFINSFFLQSASEQEVTEICSSFRSGTAPGYDSISMNVVKESFNLICAQLTYIINWSLNSGVVPQEMKIA